MKTVVYVDDDFSVERYGNMLDLTRFSDKTCLLLEGAIRKEFRDCAKKYGYARACGTYFRAFARHTYQPYKKTVTADRLRECLKEMYILERE